MPNRLCADPRAAHRDRVKIEGRSCAYCDRESFVAPSTTELRLKSSNQEGSPPIRLTVFSISF